MNLHSKVDRLLNKDVVDVNGNIEVLKDVHVNAKKFAWFVDKIFNPEGNIWIWIRRISNILTFPILILVLINLFA